MIKQGDWVLICEISERGCVIEVFDDGERFLVNVPESEKCPQLRRFHVSVEKVRKIKAPKENKLLKLWKQTKLF